MTPYQKLIKALNQDHSSSQAVFDILERHDFEQIGDGAYSAVFGKNDEPYVVKVNTVSDPAAFKFYSAIQQKQLRHFPAVHKLRTYVDDEGEFLFIVVMERLHPYSWCKANRNGRSFVKWLVTRRPYHAEIGKVKENNKIASQWEKKNKASVKIIQSIFDMTAEYGIVDLHEGNVMVRLPEGDVVLIDPVCS